jgi:hypothetical protein
LSEEGGGTASTSVSLPFAEAAPRDREAAAPGCIGLSGAHATAAEEERRRDGDGRTARRRPAESAGAT